MKSFIVLLGWCLLFVLCWPLALLAVLLWPVVWLVALPVLRAVRAAAGDPVPAGAPVGLASCHARCGLGPAFNHYPELP